MSSRKVTLVCEPSWSTPGSSHLNCTSTGPAGPTLLLRSTPDNVETASLQGALSNMTKPLVGRGRPGSHVTNARGSQIHNTYAPTTWSKMNLLRRFLSIPHTMDWTGTVGGSDMRFISEPPHVPEGTGSVFCLSGTVIAVAVCARYVSDKDGEIQARYSGVARFQNLASSYVKDSPVYFFQRTDFFSRARSSRSRCKGPCPHKRYAHCRVCPYYGYSSVVSATRYKLTCQGYNADVGIYRLHPHACDRSADIFQVYDKWMIVQAHPSRWTWVTVRSCKSRALGCLAGSNRVMPADGQQSCDVLAARDTVDWK
nr:hypothetical protein CFP56_04462 [Quercus suber]